MIDNESSDPGATEPAAATPSVAGEPQKHPRARPERDGWDPMALLDQAMRRRDGLRMQPYRHPLEIPEQSWEADKVTWCGQWRIYWPVWGHDQRQPSVVLSARSVEAALAYIDQRWPMSDWWLRVDTDFAMVPPKRIVAT